MSLIKDIHNIGVTLSPRSVRRKRRNVTARRKSEKRTEGKFDIQWEETALEGLKYLNLFLLLSIFISGAAAFKAPDATIRLEKEDLEFLFGDKEVPPHSLVNIRSRPREKRSSDTLTESPGFLDLVVEDEEERLEFELRPNTALVSPDFVIVVRDTNGSTKEKGVVRPSCVYVGAAKGHPETQAALSNCDGKGFTGVIVANNYTHLVKPLLSNSLRRRRRKRQDVDGSEEEFEKTPDGLHVIHSRSRNSKCAVYSVQAMRAPKEIVILPDNYQEDLNATDTENGTSENATVTENSKEKKHNISKRAAVERLQIETAVFVDDKMYTVIDSQNPKADNIVETITDIVFAIMNGVHLLYNAPSLDIHFTIMLVRLDIIKDPTKGPSKAGGDIQRYLSNFCYWQRNLNRLENPGGDASSGFWDHALMLSGVDLWDGKPESDSVIGLAWVSGMCHPTYSCTINEGTSFEAVYVITHEMGHNLGMSHDGSLEDKNTCDPDTYIMSPSTGPGKVTWSKCSNSELKTFLKDNEYSADCLDDLARGPRELDFSDGKLPGEIYTVNQQCTYALGSTFKPYVTSKYPYNNVCRETWCQNTTHAMRIHPALEGTSCGVKKFCVNGNCENKPANAIESATTAITTTTATTEAPSKSKGFRDFFKRIRNLFKRYLYLRKDLPTYVFTSKWTLTNQTMCSVACGGGWLMSNVSCATYEGKIIVEDDMCDPKDKPPNKSACNTNPCKIGDPLPSPPSDRSLPFPSG
ncbi:A disintegrin and metalloproteinase with thrombospondin motifs adt-2-like [Macrobrachium nipponense]|uniref:A disintegrin and metalloproteinase with thrombospondin motifs adt-2-like n=1 Tax=Macrobrachium nipponense TaxID=159736 RepID=UPI0030C82D9D